MNQAECVQRIIRCGVMAIVRLRTPAELLPVARAIRDGGIDVIEFTVTTPGALQVIEEGSREFGDEIVIGAGTVLDPETARAAILAGARFIVSPNTRRETLTTCRRYGVASLPGAMTPTEILTAWEWGADLVKVFPATGLGPKYIKDVLAPLPQVRLVPVGGVDLGNIADFVRAGAVAVAVGSNLVDAETVARRDYDVLTQRAAAFRAAFDAARG
jgi:2-dehydro-3-deoxyphosphogluconate aldolase / (4S)-4-hydroxy-2-oxoglutarate aldolase